jgi:hypothetical protein
VGSRVTLDPIRRNIKRHKEAQLTNPLERF